MDQDVPGKVGRSADRQPMVEDRGIDVLGWVGGARPAAVPRVGVGRLGGVVEDVDPLTRALDPEAVVDEGHVLVGERLVEVVRMERGRVGQEGRERAGDRIADRSEVVEVLEPTFDRGLDIADHAVVVAHEQGGNRDQRGVVQVEFHRADEQTEFEQALARFAWRRAPLDEEGLAVLVIRTDRERGRPAQLATDADEDRHVGDGEVPEAAPEWKPLLAVVVVVRVYERQAGGVVEHDSVEVEVDLGAGPLQAPGQEVGRILG